MTQKKSSVNGSLGDISSNKTENTGTIEEKYRVLIDGLKGEIKEKDKHIGELEAMQTADFEKSKDKILAIESELADARNEVKKL